MLGRLLLVLVGTATAVTAHGRMTSPPSRYGIGFDDFDHQRNPMNLRGQVMPYGWTTPLLPCGGVLKSQSEIPETPVTAGADLEVSWEMGLWTGAALHQGWVETSIKSATDDDSGDWKSLNNISIDGLTTVDSTPHGYTVSIPSSFAPGDKLTLRWIWYGSVTDEIYYNCADLVVKSTAVEAKEVYQGPTTSTAPPTSWQELLKDSPYSSVLPTSTAADADSYASSSADEEYGSRATAAEFENAPASEPTSASTSSTQSNSAVMVVSSSSTVSTSTPVHSCGVPTRRYRRSEVK
ncbi:hypothetical protein DFJ73DRAFT_92746 [Zopfochytrium polystomum]|nr:hypothetical protein DFJ73DRAFT_92746 [Zopfochytrium polystomum]